jgi:hypothetical protein
MKSRKTPPTFYFMFSIFSMYLQITAENGSIAGCVLLQALLRAV